MAYGIAMLGTSLDNFWAELGERLAQKPSLLFQEPQKRKSEVDDEEETADQ